MDCERPHSLKTTTNNNAWRMRVLYCAITGTNMKLFTLYFLNILKMAAVHVFVCMYTYVCVRVCVYVHTCADSSMKGYSYIINSSRIYRKHIS